MAFIVVIDAQRTELTPYSGKPVVINDKYGYYDNDPSKRIWHIYDVVEYPDDDTISITGSNTDLTDTYYNPVSKVIQSTPYVEQTGGGNGGGGTNDDTGKVDDLPKKDNNNKSGNSNTQVLASSNTPKITSNFTKVMWSIIGLLLIIILFIVIRMTNIFQRRKKNIDSYNLNNPYNEIQKT